MWKQNAKIVTMKLKITCLLLISFLMTSCSCLRSITGSIHDRETQQPISFAKISVVNKGFERHFESDSLGYFDVHLTGGCKCPRIKATVEAANYKTTTFKEPKKKDTLSIFLDRKN